MSKLTIRQLAVLLANKPRYRVASFNTNPYLCPEIFAGDTIDYVNGNYGNGYPVPSSSTTLQIGSNNKTLPYVTQNTDIGNNAQITQSVTNIMGTTTSTSSSVPVVNPVTYYGLGLIGGNVSQSVDWGTNRLFNNAVFDSRGFGVQGTYQAGNITLDSNGWPTAICELVLTSSPATGLDGQLPAGTYYGQYQSTGTSATVISSGTASISNIVNTGSSGSWNTTFTITLTTGSIAILEFSSGIQNLVIPRDGSNNFTQSLFNTQAIAYYSQFKKLRLMEFCNGVASPDTTWSSRTPNCANITAGFTPTYNQYSWELIIQFINAIATYSVSVLQSVWICVPAFSNTSYMTILATLFNTYPINSNIQIQIEVADETWNSSFPFWTANLASAITEAKVIGNYATVNNVASVVSNGSVVTVTTIGLLPSFVTGSAIITNQNNPGWNAGSVGSPVSIAITGENTFTYPCSIAAGTMTITDNFAAIFNTTSSLVADNTGATSLYYLSNKWAVRYTYQMQQAWSIIRPSDKWIQGSQAANDGLSNMIFAYASYIGGGSCSWLWGVSIAPYAASTGSSTTPTQIFNDITNALVGVASSVKNHVYRCLSYGVKALLYEGGPDTSLSLSSQVISTHTDPRMNSFVTSYLNTIYENGCQDFHYLSISPQTFTNESNGAWSICQSFTDTTSPKYEALQSFKTAVRNYSNIYGSPGTISGLSYSGNVGNVANNTTNQLAWLWGNNTITRSISWLFVVNRTRRFSISIYGSDSVTTTVQILIDGIIVGSVTLPTNGNSGDNTTIPNLATSIFEVNMTAGPHILTTQFAPGQGVQPGISQIIFNPN